MALIDQVSSDSYTRFVSRFLFPLHERLKGHDTVATLRELERTQWLPREELLALQSRRLQALIERATTRVPYYREMFQRLGIEPTNIRQAADLIRLPLLDKAAIRAAGAQLRAEDAGFLTKASTSGSTGEALQLWLGKERIAHDVAARWRATRWWAVDVGDPEVVLWASPIEAGTQDTVRHLRDRLLRSTFIDARDLSEARIPKLLAQIEKVNPRLLVGYASALARIAALGIRRGLRFECSRLKYVVVTAAKILDEQRAQVGRFFGVPTADLYGGRDSGFVAHDCPQGTRHICEEDIIVEVLDDDGQPAPEGAIGELVITHLATGDFPLIRYRVGDRGALGPASCPCGRSLRALECIEGRQNDLLLGRGGRVMHHTGISNVIKDVPGLLNYRVVQESLDLIRVQVASSTRIRPEDEKMLRSALQEQLGSEIRVDVEQKADIEPDAAGKHRFIICRVNQPG